jgi:hypothetical protein
MLTPENELYDVVGETKTKLRDPQLLGKKGENGNTDGDA